MFHSAGPAEKRHRPSRAFEDPMAFQNEDDHENEEKGPPPPPVLNFVDIECSLTEERVFMPNLISRSSEEDDEIFHSDSIENFLQAPGPGRPYRSGRG